MTQKNNGGPAFPIETTATPYAPGMTLRDAAALAALPAIIHAFKHDTPYKKTKEQMFARMAWAVADAMLAERERD